VGISNPSTVLRTGIEQGILNDEVGRAPGRETEKPALPCCESGGWLPPGRKASKHTPGASFG